MALVRDIKGVCRRRETLVITPKPINVASIKTKIMEKKSVDCGAAFSAEKTGADEKIKIIIR
jgi:hypothetical protein